MDTFFYIRGRMEEDPKDVGPVTPTDIRFSVGDEPDYAVLELDTPVPVRVLLTKGQIERLIQEANMTLSKIKARNESKGKKP